MENSELISWNQGGNLKTYWKRRSLWCSTISHGNWLFYMSTVIRPGLVALNCHTNLIESLGKITGEGVTRILLYVKGTLDYGLILSQGIMILTEQETLIPVVQLKDTSYKFKVAEIVSGCSKRQAMVLNYQQLLDILPWESQKAISLRQVCADLELERKAPRSISEDLATDTAEINISNAVGIINWTSSNFVILLFYIVAWVYIMFVRMYLNLDCN